METSNVMPAAGSLFEKGKLFLKAVIIFVMAFFLWILTIKGQPVQDYSLLMGSVGLFIALGIIMYFSRKLQW